jgi:hypothetical protein
MRTPTNCALALICGLTIATPACTTDVPRAHSSALSTAPFDQYRTFSFGSDESAPEGAHTSSRTLEARRRAREAITTALVAKGYSTSEAKGDFVVMFGTGRMDEDFIRRPSHADWLDEDEDEDFTVGALVIDMFDGANGGQIWHGASRVEINPDKVDPGLVQRSVYDVLKSFPVARHATKSVARETN